MLGKKKLCNAYVDDSRVVKLIERFVLQTQLHITRERTIHFCFVTTKTFNAVIVIIVTLVFQIVIFLAVIFVHRVHIFTLYDYVCGVAAVLRGTGARGAVAIGV